MDTGAYDLYLVGAPAEYKVPRRAFINAYRRIFIVKKKFIEFYKVVYRLVKALYTFVLNCIGPPRPRKPGTEPLPLAPERYAWSALPG